MATNLPLLFPAIGASAAVMAFTPQAPGARPRNCLLGHAIGAGIGWVCVQTIAGGVPHALASPLQWPWMLSGAFALGLTVAILLAVDLPHPPAA
ncbi:MAG: HPP family protein, partial [Planctomycetia bacterium]